MPSRLGTVWLAGYTRLHDQGYTVTLARSITPLFFPPLPKDVTFASGLCDGYPPNEYQVSKIRVPECEILNINIADR
jgi:hypothetical protein